MSSTPGQLSILKTDSFAHLADVSSHPGSKLFSSSWCPTMDLFVIATPLSNRHRLTLWKMGGNKLWDVEVGRGEASSESIVDVVWSPSGLEIAIAHHPPRLSIHSVHDGREIRSLVIPAPKDETLVPKLAAVWWLEDAKSPEPDGLDILLCRNGNIPSSAHSVLQTLPLLDALNDEGEALSAPIYNLKKDKDPSIGTLQRNASSLSPELDSFPTLTPNLVVASIAAKPSVNAVPPLNTGKNKQQYEPAAPTTAQEPLNENMDKEVQNSLLIASDDIGQLYIFLEGSYPLGQVSLGTTCSTTCIVKPSQEKPVLLAHNFDLAERSTSLLPVSIELPLLASPSLRSVSKMSTSVRALLVYVARVLEDMRRAWFGTDSLDGGRDAGKKWIKLLEEKERQLEGRKKTHGLYELTNLLFTGKTSAAMREFLGGSGKLSERGMAQWESTVHGALTVLQESAERKLAPACERLIILLEEVRGWSAWPQRYSAYQFDTSEVDECLALCHRTIELVEWLSKASLEEFERFHEFMKWTKVETSRVTDGQVGDLRAPTYDPLEVSDYLENGLLHSSLDKWFVGPMPKLNPSEVHPSPPSTMGEMMNEMRKVIEIASSPDFVAGGARIPVMNGTTSSYETRIARLEKLDRNLIALTSQLITKCEKIFKRASGATGRGQIMSGVPKPEPSGAGGSNAARADPLVRERMVPSAPDRPGSFFGYFAVALPKDRAGQHDHRALAVFAVEHESAGIQHGHPTRIRCCVLECRAVEAGSEEDEGGATQACALEMLDLDFFDDETLLLVMRTLEPEEENDIDTVFGRPYLMSVAVTELPFAEIVPDLGARSRERLMEQALQMCTDGLLQALPLPITRSRRLNSCTTGDGAKLAVNGADNRRCACVLDMTGQFGEIFDIDAEGDDEDEDEEEGGQGSIDGDVGAVRKDSMEE
ncbi:hypothetical protein FRB93_012505 [Tulasnella sp. JGI-2019a]|nr:hypothetical protein FRB93_012505 [Tulasnella sp. JGI-2019a]